MAGSSVDGGTLPSGCVMMRAQTHIQMRGVRNSGSTLVYK